MTETEQRPTPADPWPGDAADSLPSPTGRSLPPELGPGAVAVLEGVTFMYSDATGDVPPGSIGGLVHRDTRLLSTWVLTINGPQGTVDTDAVLKQTGDKVTGVFSSQLGETNVEGSMSGSTLSLAFNVVTPNGPIDIRLTAEVSGADMKGTVDYGMGTADFTGKKK